jgi:hypothetical protein
MAELQSYVHVADEEGRHGVFGPGDDVPEWAAARITNPKAWKDGVLPDVAEQTAAEDPGTGGGEPTTTAEAQTGGGQGSTELQEPPRSGAGSGLEAWVEYAKALGYEVAEGAKRDDIIAAIDAEKE